MQDSLEFAPSWRIFRVTLSPVPRLQGKHSEETMWLTAHRFIDSRYDVWLRFTFPIVGLLAIASGIGVFFKGFYRDTTYYSVMAVGQDFFSFIVVVPALALAALMAHRTSFRALFVWLGIVIYLTYTYAIAAFDNQFNALFLVYVTLFGCSLYALIGGFLSLNKDGIKARFAERTPVRAISLYLGTLAVLFYFTWLREVIPALLTGTVPQSVKDSGTPTNAVHVLDMSWILPALLITAVNLWRRRSLGYLLAGPMLSFIVFVASAVLCMVISMSRAGYPLEVPQVILFTAMLAGSLGLLIWYLRSLKQAKVAAANAIEERYA
jgi:hypothetical protein